MTNKDFNVCFTVQYKRKGIFKLMEQFGWIKKKNEGFELIFRKDGDVDVFSSADSDFVSVKNVSVRGLPQS